MLDFSYHVLSVSAHELCSFESGSSGNLGIGRVDDEMQRMADKFCGQARSQRAVIEGLFGTLEANDPRGGENIVTFHPPGSDEDMNKAKGKGKRPSAVGVGRQESLKTLPVMKEVAEAPEPPPRPMPKAAPKAVPPAPPPRLGGGGGATTGQCPQQQ